MASTMFAVTSIFPESLNHNNYNHWSMRVKTYLLAEGLWNVIKETTKPEHGDSEPEWLEAWTMKNAKALHVIQNSCGSDMFSLISEIDTAKTAWEILERECKELKADTEIVLEKEEEGKSVRTAIQTQRKEDKEIKASEGENNANDFKRYEPFFHHVVSGKWPEAKECLEELDINEAVRARDPRDQNTALHLAAKEGHINIVKELLLVMSKEDLEVKNRRGYTPLGNAVRKGYGGVANAEVARYIIEKNKNVLTIGINPPHNWLPVVEACSWNRWELAHYLYSVTPYEALLTETRPDGPQILTYCFKHMKGFDIARDILKRKPILALAKNYDGEFPMSVLACVHSGSFSGRQLKRLWQKWIYNSIHIKLVDPIHHEISINVPKQEDDQAGSPTQDPEEDAFANNHYGARRTSTYSVVNLSGIMRGAHKVLGIKSIYEMKLIDMQILKFLQWIGDVIKREKLTEVQWNIVKTSLFRAVERGNVEFVTQIFIAAKKHIGTTMKDEKGRNIFHVAIECRQENIYNLINGVREEKRRNLGCTITNFKESMLHMAGNLSPLSQINHIKGAYLQMQRELQWFKEVETIVPKEMHESLNSSDETARDLFTRNHKTLMADAENSIKGIANSCTVVGALIVTIMFAVAYTVPGGSDGNTGLPIFMDKKLFKIFIISDVISLVSSTTSVIIFLGILTSRYAEDDFLTSLPTKMMIGLSTLFLSISTMMIAFSSALTIMNGDNGNSKTFIRNLLLAFLPITSFIWMQFSFIFEIFISTYGPGIFNKMMKPWY